MSDRDRTDDPLYDSTLVAPDYLPETSGRDEYPEMNHHDDCPWCHSASAVPMPDAAHDGPLQATQEGSAGAGRAESLQAGSEGQR